MAISIPSLLTAGTQHIGQTVADHAEAPTGEGQNQAGDHGDPPGKQGIVRRQKRGTGPDVFLRPQPVGNLCGQRRLD